MNTGDQLCRSRNGLLTTVAVGLDGKVDALELRLCGRRGDPVGAG